jgi:hypothetical protein
MMLGEFLAWASDSVFADMGASISSPHPRCNRCVRDLKNVGSQRFEPSIAHLLTPLRRGWEQVSVAFSASARTNGALKGLRCIVSAEAVQVGSALIIADLAFIR